ncbi:MAG: phospho-sugar mutase [Clostridiales Family XIII bacterium]|jgi:phosphoglucomutase|nr:phospho-sugar mutase [Clostridiales Family XIII bacterium]
MTDIDKKLNEWLSMKWLDSGLRSELADLVAESEREGASGPAHDELEDRFYRDLEFGTAGLRGILAAGSNRMNTPNILRTSQGFAEHLNAAVTASGEKRRAQVAIAYDNRRNSELFAFEAACVFVANGIETHLFGRLSATPLLSYTVRRLGCDGGVVVTASHNPKEYNGYKIYGHTGCQCLPDEASRVAARIAGVDFENGIRTVAGKYTGSVSERRAAAAAAEPLIHIIPEAFEEEFVDEVLASTPEHTGIDYSRIKVVYTPLHGAGNIPVRAMFAKIGLTDVTVVPEQELPDPEFTTCPQPNPENPKALTLGLELCRKLRDDGEAPDLLIATDPDSDRIAVAVYHNGEYALISGNQFGVLLFDFVMRRRRELAKHMPFAALGANSPATHTGFPNDQILVTTIVSTPLASVMAAENGVETRKVLTGFKNIGKVMDELASAGEENRYLFGFEESCGYLSGTHVRDKDAVNASALICALTARCKASGLSVIDRLDEIGGIYGYYHDETVEFIMPGEKGMEDMLRVMEHARSPQVRASFGETLADYTDYLLLPAYNNNVLEFAFSDGSRVRMRPSGTEPKLKIYFSARAETKERAAAAFTSLREKVISVLGL